MTIYFCKPKQKMEIAMSFEEIYNSKLFGAIRGFDRIRFRGTILSISESAGLGQMLCGLGVLLVQFKEFFLGITARILAGAKKYCEEKNVEYIWAMEKADKDAMAKRALGEKPAGYTGPLFCLGTLEGCVTANIVRNKSKKRLELAMKPGKCTHLYLYFNHREYGLGHVRLQTWAPFGVHVCLNGRSWLENQLKASGLRYEKAENCFRWLEDAGRAQALFDAQLASDWKSLLDGLVAEFMPWLEPSLGGIVPKYYWSADETEFATDYMFRNGGELDRMFPMFVRFAMMTSDCPAVMRFFGKKPGWQGGGNPPKDLRGDSRRRHEGVRVKHCANGNSVKAYNKQGTVLRVETTINNTRFFDVYRHPNDDPSRPMGWLPMRKGVADLCRRAEVSDRINRRYADHIAAADTGERFGEVVGKVCRKASLQGRNGKSVNVRALRPGDPLDRRLLEFLKKGDWDLNGFANRDLDMFLNNGRAAKDAVDKKHRSAKASRLIRLLRAHGLVKKVKNKNRYMVTEYGHKLGTAIALAENVSIKKLGEKAA